MLENPYSKVHVDDLNVILDGLELKAKNSTSAREREDIERIIAEIKITLD